MVISGATLSATTRRRGAGCPLNCAAGGALVITGNEGGGLSGVHDVVTECRDARWSCQSRQMGFKVPRRVVGTSKKDLIVNHGTTGDVRW